VAELGLSKPWFVLRMCDNPLGALNAVFDGQHVVDNTDDAETKKTAFLPPLPLLPECVSVLTFDLETPETLDSQLSVAPTPQLSPSSTPKKKKRNPWTDYDRRSQLVSVPRPAFEARPLSTEPVPERARDSRTSPFNRRGVSIPAYVKQAKIQEQDGRCAYCEREFSVPASLGGKIEFFRAEAEHFIARSAGGRTTDANVLYACHVCNRLNGDFLFTSVEEASVWLVKQWEIRGYGSCSTNELATHTCHECGQLKPQLAPVITA
jgi:hypothetical protein